MSAEQSSPLERRCERLDPASDRWRYVVAFAVYVPAGFVLGPPAFNWIIGLSFPLVVVRGMPRLRAGSSDRRRRAAS